jgi:hypothetical protein
MVTLRPLAERTVIEAWRGSPRQSWRGDPAFVDQWMVNGADTATLYGVVTLLFNWTM